MGSSKEYAKLYNHKYYLEHKEGINRGNLWQKVHLGIREIYQSRYKAKHPEIIKAGQDRYYQEHRKEKILSNIKYGHDKGKRLRLEILNFLGDKCTICGYSGPAIQIDHIKNGGRRERKGKNQIIVYSEILSKIKVGSKDYQLLCANCNWEKEIMRRQSTFQCKQGT
jgi:hypothetical protein